MQWIRSLAVSIVRSTVGNSLPSRESVCDGLCPDLCCHPADEKRYSRRATAETDSHHRRIVGRLADAKTVDDVVGFVQWLNVTKPKTVDELVVELTDALAAH